MEIKLLGGTTKEELENRIQKVAAARKIIKISRKCF